MKITQGRLISDYRELLELYEIFGWILMRWMRKEVI